MTFRKDVLAELDSFIMNMECSKNASAKQYRKQVWWIKEIRDDVEKALRKATK